MNLNKPDSITSAKLKTYLASMSKAERVELVDHLATHLLAKALTLPELITEAMELRMATHENSKAEADALMARLMLR